MPDPWLTKKGDVVPALKIAGMPEWVPCAGERQRLQFQDDGEWHISWFNPLCFADGLPACSPGWTQHGALTAPHAAHALIEKWLREWLLERGWKVMWSFRRQVYVIFERVSGQGYFREDLGSFETEAEALQAAVMAAKETGHAALPS